MSTEQGIDIFIAFNINIHAWRYFGIICFTDMPGFYPQLGMYDD